MPVILDDHDKRWLAHYDKQALADDRYQPLAAGTGRPMFEDLSPEHTVADFGCGYGRAVPVLESFGIRGYLGLDFSEEQIALARRLHPGQRFEVCNLYDVGETYPEAFDGFLLTAVLMCIPRRRAVEALSSIYASLKPDARGYIATPVGQGAVINRRGMPIHQYSMRELQKVLNESRFVFEIMEIANGTMIVGTVRRI